MHGAAPGFVLKTPKPEQSLEIAPFLHIIMLLCLRALEDIQESVKELKYYRTAIFKQDAAHTH